MPGIWVHRAHEGEDGTLPTVTTSPAPGPLQRYPRRHGATGDLRRWRDVELPGLGRRSDLYVWLPPRYDRHRSQRYPVVYLHDGDNLFDRRKAFAGVTWEADRALMALHDEGHDVIAVGVPCSPHRRIEEYSPYHQRGLGGGDADAYVAFLTDHLKPWVDAALRTRPEREHTMIAGSSLGGVVSLHAWLRRPDVFGGIGAFSTAFWVPGERHLRELEEALAAPHPPTRFYLDVGGREIPDAAHRQDAYQRDTERVVGAMQRAGVPLLYTYDSQAYHFENAWAARLPAALSWLTAGYAVEQPSEPRGGLLATLRSGLRRLAPARLSSSR